MTEISHHDKQGRGTFSVHISFVQKLSEGARVIGNQPPRSSFKKEINPLVRGLLVIHCSANRKLMIMKTTLKVGIFMEKNSLRTWIIRGIPRLTPPIEELSRSKLLIIIKSFIYSPFTPPVYRFTLDFSLGCSWSKKYPIPRSGKRYRICQSQTVLTKHVFFFFLISHSPKLTQICSASLIRFSLVKSCKLTKIRPTYQTFHGVRVP